MKSRVITLYKNHKNSVGTWRIWYQDYAPGYMIFIAHTSTEGGQEMQVTEHVTEGKASRSVKEQTISRVRSRINTQLDKGYVKTREDAVGPPKNTLGLVQPMLAMPEKRVKSIRWQGAIVQPKLDGHRCLIASTEEGVIAYSRKGKPIDAIDHITDEWFDLPVGTVLDGELYHHGTKLQTIGSWIKRKQENTRKLQYVVYDLVDIGNYADRSEKLENLFLQRMRVMEHSKLIQQHVLNVSSNHMDHAKALMMKFRTEGYEGAMIRHGDHGYEIGRRSSSLVKLKVFEDQEFRVFDITESKEGWGVLHMLAPNGKRFRASAPGTHAEKEWTLKMKENYIGKLVTVEFAHWTDEGKPFQPVAIRWRNDI